MFKIFNLSLIPRRFVFFVLLILSLIAPASAEFDAPVNHNVSPCSPQPADILGWYKGEANISDSSGHFRNGIFFSGTYSTGKVGQAFNFNGTDNYAQSNLAVSYRRNEEITFAAWIKPATNAGSQTIVSRFDYFEGNFKGDFQFSLLDQKLYFEVQQNNTTRSFISTNSVITAGVYQHVVATFNTTTQQTEIFVNGSSVPVTLVSSGTITSIQGFFNTVTLGGLSLANDRNIQYFGGQIDEALLFDRALSISEIQSLYNADSEGLCSNYRVSGKIITPSGRYLGSYYKDLEQGKNHIVLPPPFSTHSFIPASYLFNPLTGNETGKDFIATLINDDFAHAVTLTEESGEIFGNNQDATREIGEPLHAGVVGGTSVWYRWKAPRNGTFTFSLGNSKFDTLLAVYQGTGVGKLSRVAANDNLDAATFSQVTFTVQANADYYIAVDGSAGLAGSGDFTLTYYPIDYIYEFTVSGSVIDGRQKIPGVTIKAESLDGRIIATSLTDNNGAYSIAIPQGVNSFKLVAQDYGFANFSNITQNRNQNFTKSSNRIAPAGIFGEFLGLNNGNNLSVIVTGTNIVGSQQCSISSETTYICAGLLPFGTYTITPSHPSIAFLPASRTFVQLGQNILGASFVAVTNSAPDYTISGRVTQGNIPLNKVEISIDVNTYLTFDRYYLTAETDADGNYSFSHLPAGFDYHIAASLAGFNFISESPSEFTNLQNNQTINFSGASNCSYTLSALRQTIPAAGGFYSLNINTNAGCAWEAKTNSTALKITTPLSYGTGTIAYYVEANSGMARTGIITVVGQTLTVNQAAYKSRKRVRFF